MHFQVMDVVLAAEVLHETWSAAPVARQYTAVAFALIAEAPLHVTARSAAAGIPAQV